MNILFQSRKTLFSVPGGDTIQILKTKEYLEKLGVKVDITTELTPDISNYDLIHVFNLMRPQDVYLQIKNAKKYNKPVALSTIYGLYTEYDRKARTGIMGKVANILSTYQIEYLKVFARAILNFEFSKGTLVFLSNGYLRLQKKICKMTDVYLPNSDTEMNRVAHDIGLTNYKYVSIPNAVDIDKFSYDKVNIESDMEIYKDCILCVARIEGRKSQLNLIKAVKGLPYKLVIIGKPGPNSIKYYDECKKEANENVIFLGHIDHEKLPMFYKIAKVHALISWMETPGLSSLEAAAMKCNIVATKKGDTEYYFKDYAYYCEPDNIDSIRKAIQNAFEIPYNDNFLELIKNNYNWGKTAKLTLDAYNMALK